ncbi:MAG: radical SAM family heme chaperone HemW [Flavobacteriales bacterium]|nr:radical SAM family heme chaperone HemW [Flavobacteriales bacterium]
MSGIYIHIPYCKKACHYCDFHFSTTLHTKTDLIESMVREIEDRKNYLEEPVETIYFGGGTPSLLDKDEIDTLLKVISTCFNVIPNPEITLEANPDDLTSSKLIDLKSSMINRLSIGIQSFRNQDLELMNRAHNAKEAFTSVKIAKELGFDNITIDLIYGIPNLSLDAWQENIESALSLDIQHLSAYCLTIEERTVFHKWQSSKKIALPEDQVSLAQFRLMQKQLKANGFEQYEISNFGKPGFYSKHNANYWRQKTYLGIGPSAHSFNGTTRSWNVRNNPTYIKAIQSGTAYSEEEVLSEKDKFNEYILTGLRTKWGISLEILNQFKCYNSKELKSSMAKWADQNHVQLTGTQFTLTDSGKFVADAIISDLFLV